MVFETESLVLAALAAAAGGAAALLWVRARTAAVAPPPPVTVLTHTGDAVLTDDNGCDRLTGLPLRAAFDEALMAAVHAADDHAKALSVLCIGIDGFDLLNEAYGRPAGDALLRTVASRLTKLREGDLPLARTAGAEFVFVVSGAIEPAREAAQRLLREIAQPMTVDGQLLRTTASIGIACYPEHGAGPLLVGQAVLAQREARDSGGAAFAEYEPHMGEDQREQNELARDLRRAIDRNELCLYYQPKVDGRNLQITAAEALVRWQHPTRGLVSPGVFIPIAERHGLIAAVGQWVMEEAARQAGEWRDRGMRMRVAINVSGFQMRQDDFAERLRVLLERHRLRPERFTCEITETVAMEDTQITKRAFEQLRALGVHVSIDDFGTGHSSLALLRRLPAAELKIDRAFVTDLGKSADAAAVVKAIVQLAHTLDLRVVAEGVETDTQRDMLLQLGCDELQGFLFARPMPPKSLELWAVTEREAQAPGFRASLFLETNPAEL